MSTPRPSALSLSTALSFPSMLKSGALTLARRVVLSQFQGFQRGRLTVYNEDFDGSKEHMGPGGDSSLAVELRVHAPFAWIRILVANDIGFAEAYMMNEISCSDLTAFFRLCLLNASAASSSSALVSTMVAAITGPLHQLSNTSDQALANARDHYSLSNDMFKAFLDNTMTYSAPLWLPKSNPDHEHDSLEAAQIRKLQYIISAARIKPTDHVLEIGTGWGSFAIEAVRQTGCRVTTVTASSEQAVLARDRIAAAGCAKQTEVMVCDYRDIPLLAGGARYDKIVSIEMIEHVGRKYLDTYFDFVNRHLKEEGGIGVFQCITIPEARYAGYCSRSDFIQRYIFPGGHLPTVSGLVKSIDQGSQGGLVVEDIKSVSGHYVRALREWREKFLRNWDSDIRPSILKSKPDMTEADTEVFKRKWEYYFSYCEAGFATKALGDVTITVAREGAVELIEDIPL